MANVTRREFLKITFGTASAAALSGPLTLVLPKEAHSRPVAEPRLIDLEDGYLVDGEWDESMFPTYREQWGYDTLSIKEKVETLLDHWGYDEKTLAQDYEIIRPPKGWDAQSIAEIESTFGDLLDDQVDTEDLSFNDQLRYGPYSVGKDVLDVFNQEEQKELGLWIVEGEHPGSDFCGVRFAGDIDELNEALARHGVNIRVRN